MSKKNHFRSSTLFLFILFLLLLSLHPALAGETPTTAIEEAKAALDEARKVGADQKGYDDLLAAKSWLLRAEKEYSEAKSFLSRFGTTKTHKTKDEEIIYLATMAKIKAQIAENKARKQVTEKELQDTRKDLADYRSALTVLREKLADAEKAKEIQSQAEAERKDLAEAKRKAIEMEAQKKKELEEVQRRTLEMETLKERELQEAKLKEAQRALTREKELGEARLKAEQMASQRVKEGEEKKAREEQLLAERKKSADLQKKTLALEREKAMLADAGRIPNAAVKSGEKEMVIALLALTLFSPSNDLKPSGKSILDSVGKFLKSYPEKKVIIRGHTDTVGKQAANQTVSEKRAQRVREYLVAYQNILPTRITALGSGSSQPAAPNDTEAGRALNRRVEIAVLVEE